MYNRYVLPKDTYYPTGVQTGTNRDSTFLIARGGLKIYGGYPSGGGTRNVTANTTILSGDIGTKGTNTDNSYHVMIIAGIASSADSIVVDGFTFTGAHSTGSNVFNHYYNSIAVAQYYGGGIAMYSVANAGKSVIRNCIFSENSVANVGGGMYNTSSSPMIINCIFSVNSAASGSAIYNASSSSPMITNCFFLRNKASFYGGGIYNITSSSPTVVNCTFAGNNAGTNGGGMFNSSSSPVVTNCSFSGNNAGSGGGGMHDYNSSSPIVTNCSFSGNNAGSGGAMYNDRSCNPKISNTIIYGNSSGIYNDGSNSISTPVITYSLVEGYTYGTNDVHNLANTTDPLFVNAPAAATAPFTGGDYHIQTGSPAINAGDPSTNNSGYAVQAGSTDLDGNMRIIAARIDMGAYESNETTLPVQIGTFSAVASGKSALLHWTTLSEANNAGFEVERSVDGKSFAKIGYVTGAGTTTTTTAYSYTDHTPIIGTNYYRLKQVNYDGRYAYSDIRTVDIAATTAVTIYPNPVRSNLTVKVNAAGTFVLTDAVGHTVFSQAATAGTTLQVSMSSLASGIYFWQIAGQKGKVVKE